MPSSVADYRRRDAEHAVLYRVIAEHLDAFLECFLASGLWHGAAWNFVVWGAYHGLFLSLDRLFMKRLLGRLPRVVGIGFTFVAVTVGWVVFRAPDFGAALAYLAAMADPGRPSFRFAVMTTDLYLVMAVGSGRLLPVRAGPPRAAASRCARGAAVGDLANAGRVRALAAVGGQDDHGGLSPVPLLPVLSDGDGRHPEVDCAAHPPRSRSRQGPQPVQAAPRLSDGPPGPVPRRRDRALRADGG